MQEPFPRLYTDLASWWPLLSAPEDYEHEAGVYARALRERCDGAARSLLELGSGGGNNASHMKSSFDEVTLVDLSEGMLKVSRARNPDCDHVAGDMRAVRLGRAFDCVFVHDAVAYMATLDDLRRAIETASVHVRSGGAALFAPDHVRETFRPSTSHGGHDGSLRSLRYLQWITDPDPRDTSYVVDYAYLLRESDGTVRVERDRHVAGLFSRGQWLEVLQGAGFSTEVEPVRHEDRSESEILVCRR